jgi:hypothetical protein
MLTFSTAVRAVSYFASYKLYYIIIRLYGWTGLKYKSILSVMKSLLMNSFLSFSSLFYDRSNALCTGIGIRPYTVGKFVFAGFFMILVHTGIWPQLIWQSFDFVCVCVCVCVCVVDTAFTMDDDAHVRNTSEMKTEQKELLVGSGDGMEENWDKTKYEIVPVQLRWLPRGSWLSFFCQLVGSRSHWPHG